MNASGDRRYRRCRGLSDSFGKVKEETAGVCSKEALDGIDEEDLKKWEPAVDSKPEKKEGDEDD